MVGIGPKCSCRLKSLGEVWYEECRAHRGAQIRRAVGISVRSKPRNDGNIFGHSVKHPAIFILKPGDSRVYPRHPIAKGVVKCFWAFGLSGNSLVIKQGNGLQENPPLFSSRIFLSLCLSLSLSLSLSVYLYIYILLYILYIYIYYIHTYAYMVSCSLFLHPQWYGFAGGPSQHPLRFYLQAIGSISEVQPRHLLGTCYLLDDLRSTHTHSLKVPTCYL